MLRLFYLLAVCIELVVTAGSRDVQLVYKYDTVLDHDNLVRLRWSVDNENIMFKLTVVKHVYPMVVGFGMSDHGRFENADLVVFDISSGDRIKTFDCHTDRNGILVRDETKNYNLIEYSVEADRLVLEFERKLNTCDQDDYKIESGTVHLIHFLLDHERDLFNYKFEPFADATSADMKQAQLIKSVYFDTHPSSFDPMRSKSLQITNNKVNIPSKDTTYWCLVYKLNKSFNKKHHIVAFESVVSNSSKGVVHHMELFHCISDPSDDMKAYNGPCDSESKPKGLIQCRKVIAAWAMGAGRFVYPNHVGGVLGGENYSPYLVLEIHYDNPKLRDDIVDSSGLKIFYQGGEKLRQYDAGIMEIGLEYNPKNSIPPKQSLFHLHGYCLSECTSAGLPRNGITVFASQLHTHLTGRRVWTSVVRNNKVVKILNSDNHYDQMFQEIRLLPEPVNVRPGDALINTCVYNTNDRVNMTFGGFSIRDEMCVNYMHYYPLAELEVCKSSISNRVLDSFFAKMKKYDFANTSSEKSVEENFNSIRWTPLTSSILNKLYDISPISFSCNSSDGEHIAQVYRPQTGAKYAQYFEVIQPENLAKTAAPADEELEKKCRKNDYGEY